MPFIILKAECSRRKFYIATKFYQPLGLSILDLLRRHSFHSSSFFVCSVPLCLRRRYSYDFRRNGLCNVSVSVIVYYVHPDSWTGQRHKKVYPIHGSILYVLLSKGKQSVKQTTTNYTKEILFWT